MHARMMIAAFVVAALLLSSPCGAQTITAVEDKAGVTVTIPGAFKVLIDKKRGFGSRLYDLKNAPDYDLSSAWCGNGLFWMSTSPTEQPKHLGNQYYSNPIQKIELIESGSTRVIVKLTGSPNQWGVSWPLKGVGFEEVFTMYPNGNIYGEYAQIIGDEPVSLHYLAAGLVTNGYWGPQGADQVHAAAGELDPQKPSGAKAVPFVLQWSSGPDYLTDVLLAFREGEYGAGNLWGSNESRLFQFFTAVDMTKLFAS
jgi:hypothetical protein